MKIKITRTQLRKLIESTTKEQNKRATLNESKLANITVDTDKGLGAPDHGDLEYLETLDDEEDVEELARYDALNDDVDATLYRDNPDYRRVFKATLLNPVRDAVDSERRSMEKENARRMGIEPDLRWDYSDDEADMSDEYRRMTLSPDRAYDK